MELSLLDQARDLLASLTLAEYLATQPPRTVMSITAADPLEQVLRRFASARLVAAPCFADEQRSKYLGFLDLMDIVAAVVDAARHPPPPPPDSSGGGAFIGTPTGGGGGGRARALRHRAAAAARQLAERPVRAIRACANDAQLVYQAQLDKTLLQVVQEGFAHPVDQLACHRLAVFQPGSDEGMGGMEGEEDSSMHGGSIGGGSSSSGCLPGLGMTTVDGVSLQVTHIVSQSDILRFLYKHRSQLGQDLLDCTLEQLGIREKRVLCVPADMAVIDALAGMVDSGVPAVAVIDSLESGHLLGNLSISDLRGLLPAHFEQLSEPVGAFLREGGWHEGSSRWQPASPRGGCAAAFGIRSPEQLPHEPALAVCQLGSRFGEVLAQLATRHLHRMFLVDGEGRLVGVVSLTDILSLLAG